MINPDEPAFPNSVDCGLTIRQYAAIQFGTALAGDVEIGRWLQNDPRYKEQADGLFNFDKVLAVNAVEMADALIAELNKPRTP